MTDRKEYSIIVSGDMVIKIMTCAKCGHISVPFPCENCGAREFVKTMTRRVITPPPPEIPAGYYFDAYHGGPLWNFWTPENKMANRIQGPIKDSCQWKCPYGAPGDLLWVKESGCRYRRIGQQPGEFQIDFDGTENNWSKLNPRFFPRWACRLKLVNKSIRAERVQEITREDVNAEGLQNTGEGWAKNPWVWVVELERAE